MADVDFELKKPEKAPLLIVISGPSGIGKDTIVQGMKDRDLPFHFVITATTRPPRENEVHGEDYFFYSKAEFEKMIEQGEFLEHAWVYSSYKGVPKSQVREALNSGKDVVMRLDVQGAQTVHNLCPDAILIFLTAKDMEEWLQRLKDRRSETDVELALRIKTAKKEYDTLDIFDYIIVNEQDKLENTLDVIEDIISAEHHRVNPRKVSL
ncbi:MAG: guanylate kinase [Chloroflexota bacterium]|jgi:guanylate kinase|nr:guanylate kinase [Chloroflexota bacterium]